MSHTPFNPLLPGISVHILYKVPYTFTYVVTRRICFIIKSLLVWWSFLYSRDLNVWFKGNILGRIEMVVRVKGLCLRYECLFNECILGQPSRWRMCMVFSVKESMMLWFGEVPVTLESGRACIDLVYLAQLWKYL